MKCKVCKKRFKLRAEDRYEVRRESLGSLFSGANSSVECFNCPKCGCQNVVNEKVIQKIPNRKKASNDE